MKKWKKISALLLSTTMLCGLTACSGGTTGVSTSNATTSGEKSSDASKSDEVITIKFAGTVPDDHPITMAQYKFKEELERLSGGKMVVEIYPNAQLGTGRELIETIQLGNLQMAETTIVPFAGFTDELMSLSLPFLFPSREVAYAFADGEIGKQLADIVAEQTGVRIAGYFENGIRQFTNSKKEIKKPEDMKGLKVRVMESPVYINTFTELGASPTPMAFAEVYTALQQKTIDAQDNPFAITATNRFYEVQPYMTDLAHSFDFTGMLVSESFYQSLSDENRGYFDEAARIATEFQREKSIEKEAGYIEQIENGGTKITKLTNEERDVFRKACEPVYEWFKENYNPKTSLDTILAEVDRLTEEIGVE